MNTKICPTCKIDKQINQYNKNKNNKDGLQRECRECNHKSHDKHYHTNKSSIKYNDVKEHHKICCKCNTELSFDNFSKNKNGKFGLNAECKNCIKHRNKVWINNGGREWCNDWSKNKKQSDPQFKIKFLLRLRLLDALKRENVTKRHSALQLLGCEVSALKQHLESKFNDTMNWSNHGIYWEIDHIIPCSRFNLEDEEQQKQCFHYSNLQPLTKTENRQKSNNI
jgi:hypothetical protein